ncbi:MAG: hypothetical protein ACREBF_00460 [Candidatus Micrarchaeales archaeon]
MVLEVHKSPDGRYRTDFYEFEGQKAFAVIEKTAHGVLVSEFSKDGEVLDQTYNKSKEPLAEIAVHLKNVTEKIMIKNVDNYEHVKVNATCETCTNGKISREMDLVHPSAITTVPVIPLFVCSNCKKKLYSITQSYLKNLVVRNVGLFEPDEEKMRKTNEAAFIKEIQEYMIRIFASKKLARMKINK